MFAMGTVYHAILRFSTVFSPSVEQILRRIHPPIELFYRLWYSVPVKECSKGLVEGFVAPEPTYGFDHSHAWGGTPLYSLPKALSGFEILEPGMKKVKISLCSLGFENARVEIPTTYGNIVCEVKKDGSFTLVHPNEITVTN